MKKESLLGKILWDYNISEKDVEAVLRGKAEMAGHYTRSMLFVKILETYPWFTVLQIFSPEEVKLLLTDDILKKLRSPSLKKKYEFIRLRLQEIIPVAG
jgi:hypothetical protein